ncbi:hypothetical protein [Pseudomonas sp. RC10]|uniref:hypothetical protein n=1 Tax=Pseudomonas bambusae TaxID=3139142 RepID=UPI00313A49B5
MNRSDKRLQYIEDYHPLASGETNGFEDWKPLYRTSPGSATMPTSGLVVDFSGSFGANSYVNTRYANDLGYFLNIVDFKKVDLKVGRTVSHINMRILNVLIDPPAKFVVKAYEGSTVVHSKQFEGQGEDNIQEFTYSGQVTSLSLIVEGDPSVFQVLVGGITWTP